MPLKNYLIYLFYTTILAMVSSCVYTTGSGRVEKDSQQKDSIALWIAQAENAAPLARKPFLDKAYLKLSNLPNDTLKAKHLTTLTYLYSETIDTLSFRKVSKEAIQLNTRLNDSANLADIYWDLGDYLSGKSYKKDSAYYYYSKAQRFYERLGNDFSSVRMLINMAIEQIDIKDYTGSEITTIKAIELLRSLKKYRQLYSCYNNLGIIFNELGEYDKALEYHDQALNHSRKTDERNTLEIISFNNKGVIYKNQEKYKEAIKNYKEAQRYNNLYAKDPKWKAILIDNIAYARFKLGETSQLPDMFYESLRIRDSLNNIPGIVINKLHLAEYYTVYKDTIKALKYADEARELAESSDNYRDLLAALKLLSKLEKNEKGIIYLNRHITLSDSLQREERRIRNKFTRIRFETDELIIENIKITQTLKVILQLSFGVIAIIGLLLVIVIQRARNRALKMDDLQQKANVEIYNLMLGQHNKMEEGRQQERERISEELHDGILGMLFGTRIALGSLNTQTGEAAIEKRSKCIEELQNIEKEVRNLSHKLNVDLFTDGASFITLVTNLLETQSKISKFIFFIDNDTDIEWEDISGNVKTNLYRIVQEAVQNINKYAKANSVTIRFNTQDNGDLIMAISDNGIGFNVERKKVGIGIKNMKSRVAKLKGKIVIESARNKGTRIEIILPLNL